ncbi:hypothetical protein [Mumia sp. Pv 4-285]|uniref:hypothetical protein n=1 Tax=Mumia qirimensis TaxID=3234852 RepID=UPI00351D6CAF
MTTTPDEPNPDPKVVPSGDPVPIDPGEDPRNDPDLPEPEIVPPHDEGVPIADAEWPEDR